MVVKELGSQTGSGAGFLFPSKNNAVLTEGQMALVLVQLRCGGQWVLGGHWGQGLTGTHVGPAGPRAKHTDPHTVRTTKSYHLATEHARWHLDGHLSQCKPEISKMYGVTCNAGSTPSRQKLQNNAYNMVKSKEIWKVIDQKGRSMALLSWSLLLLQASFVHNSM